MERYLQRVRKWLDRCTRAVHHQSWSRAYAEIECARTEMQRVRDELARRAAAEGESGQPRRAAICPVLRGAGIALIVLLAIAVPLSETTRHRERDPAAEDGHETQQRRFVLVTEDEEQLLQRIREGLSRQAARSGEVAPEQQTASAVQEEKAEEENTPVAAQAGPGGGQTSAESDGGRTFRAEGRALESEPAAPQDEPSAGEVLALVQLGERVLRGPAMEVVRESNP
ncbi:MAG: hypothetical protein K9L28_04015 [Synergistales bacterium]|nr:hypothetical protein [Synergistales bacterium]